MSDGRSKDIDRPLNDNQKACVDYYLSHLPYNQTAASKFFHNPRVMKYKEERLNELYEEANINAQTIALRLGSIAFDEDKENLSSSLKAIDLLQKQLGLQSKSVNIDADVNAAVQIVEDIDIES